MPRGDKAAKNEVRRNREMENTVGLEYKGNGWRMRAKRR